MRKLGVVMLTAAVVLGLCGLAQARVILEGIQISDTSIGGNTGPCTSGYLDDKGGGEYWLVDCGGHDLWGNADATFMAYQLEKVTGNFDIACRVKDIPANGGGWSRIGLVARESLAAGAVRVNPAFTPNDAGRVAWGHRDSTNGGSNHVKDSGGDAANPQLNWNTMPNWLRLTRVGNVFTGYYADTPDDTLPTTWIAWDTATTINNMPASCYIGLVAHGRNDSSLTTAYFDNLTGFTDTPMYEWNQAGSGNWDQDPATQWVDEAGDPVTDPLYPTADWGAWIAGPDDMNVNTVTVNGAHAASSVFVRAYGGLTIAAGQSLAATGVASFKPDSEGLTVNNNASFSAGGAATFEDGSGGLTLYPGASFSAGGGKITEAVLEGTVDAATFTINTSGPMTADVVEFSPGVAVTSATFAKGGGGRLAVADGDLTNVTVQVNAGELRLERVNPTLLGSESARLSGGGLDVQAALAMAPQDNILTEWWFAGAYNDANVGHGVDVDDDPQSLLVQDDPDVARGLNVHTDFGDGDRMSERGRLIFSNAMNDPWNPDQVGMMISGTMHVETGTQIEPGDFIFVALNSDDRSCGWVDLNQNGGLDLAVFPNPLEEIVYDDGGGWYLNNSAPNAQLGPNEGDFPVAFGYQEGGGGESVLIKWWAGTVAELPVPDPLGVDKDVFINQHMHWLDPSHPDQQGIWKGQAPVGTYLDIALTVDAPGSSLNITGMAEDQPATVRELIMEDTGELATSMDGPFPTSIVLNKTTIAPGASQIGFNPAIETVPTGNEGIVNNAGGPVTVGVGGSAPLRLNMAPTVAGSLAGVTFKPTTGRLINEVATGAMDLATVNLHGGTYAGQGEEGIVPDSLRMDGHQIYGRDRLNDSVLSLDHTSSILTRTPAGFTSFKGLLELPTGTWTANIPELVRYHDGAQEDMQINFTAILHTEAAAGAENYEFRFDWSDDRGWMWLDLDQDGVFQRNNSLGQDERLAWEDHGTKTVSLDPDADYLYAAGCAEHGGGESFRAWIRTPSMGGQELINASAPSQAGLWSSMGYKGFVDSTPISVTKDSTLEGITGEVPVFTDVTLKDAILTTTTSKGASTLRMNTKVDPLTEDYVGVNTLVQTNLTHSAPIQGPGDAVPIAFQKKGPQDAIIDAAVGVATGVAQTTFEAYDGWLVLKHASDPISNADISLKGGGVRFEGAPTAVQMDIFRVDNVTPGLTHGTLDGNMSFNPNLGQHGVDPVGPSNAFIAIDPANDLWDNPDWRDDQTQVYTGEINLTTGVASFLENIDDITWLNVDGQVLLNNNQWNVATTGKIKRAPGWYPFELRMSNGGGGAGMVGNVGFGYAPYDTAGSTAEGMYFQPKNSSNDALTVMNVVTVDNPETGAIHEEFYSQAFGGGERWMLRDDVAGGLLAHPDWVILSEALPGRLHYQNDAAFNNRAGYNFQVNNQFAATWTANFTATEAGEWKLGWGHADDDVGVWVDWDDDGYGTPAPPADRMHDQGCCYGNLVSIGTWAEGETHKLLFGVMDTGGGGDFQNAYIVSPSGVRMDINPRNDPNQYAMFTAPWLGAAPLATSSLDFVSAAPVLNQLVLKNGSVRITGSRPVTINNVGVHADTGGVVGIIGEVATTITGATGVAGNMETCSIEIGGSAPVMVNKDSTGMDNAEFKVTGLMVAQVPTGDSANAGSDPLENGAVNLADGGTFRIETPTSTAVAATFDLAEYWFDNLTVVPQMDSTDPNRFLGLAGVPDIVTDPALKWQVDQGNFDAVFDPLDQPLSYPNDGDGSTKGGLPDAEWYMGLWYGTITRPAGLPTDELTFGTWSDDGSVAWVDTDPDLGVQDWQLVVDNGGDHGRQSRTGTIDLPAGTYDVAFAFYEKGGGDAMEARVGIPTPFAALGWGNLTVVEQGDVGALEWHPDAIDWTGETIVVSGNGELNAPTVLGASFGKLMMESGLLTTSGAWEGMSFSLPSVEADDTTVGIDAQCFTTLDSLDGKGHTGVVFEKRGPYDVLLTGQGVGLAGVSVTATEGNLITLAGSNPIAEATILVGGAGETILTVEDVDAPEPDPYVADYTSNAVVVAADGRLTAGSGGYGEDDVPVTVNLGNAAVRPFTMTNGTVTLRTTDDYLLNVQGTMGGPGGFAVDDADTVVNVSGGGSAGSGTVSDGTVALGDDLGVGVMKLTGGVTDTAANKLVISQRMKVDDITFGIAGGTFGAKGANVHTGRTLELDSAGSVLNIDLPETLPVANGLLGHWMFDDGTCDDSSGNDHHGAMVGPGVYDTSDTAFPNSAGSIDLNPGNPCVTVDTGGNQDVFDVDRLTVACWMKEWPTGNWNPFVSKRGESGQGWQLRRFGSSQNVSFTLRGAGGDFRGAATTAADGEWHFVAGTYDGANQTIYIDGAVDATRAQTGNINNTNHWLVFGARDNSGGANPNLGNFSHMRLDDIYIYDRGLTEEEIGQLYNGGAGPVMVAQTSVESPETDVVVSENVTITSASDEVVLGTATILGAKELTLDHAAFVLEGDLNADDGSKIIGSLEVGGNVNVGGSVGTMTMDGELVISQATYLCELDSTGSDLIHQEHLDKGIVLGGAGDESELVLTALEKVSPDCPDFVKMTILSIDGASAGELSGDFQTKPAPVTFVPDPPNPDIRVPGDYLGYGVFMDSYQYQEGVTLTKYELTVFQALEGDTDADGDVDPSDLSKLVQNWSPAGGEGKVWPQGNFNDWEDDNVGPSDLSKLVQNWAPAGYDLCPEGAPPVGGSAAVPEPGTLALLGMAGLGILMWYRRRRALQHKPERSFRHATEKKGKNPMRKPIVIVLLAVGLMVVAGTAYAEPVAAYRMLIKEAGTPGPGVHAARHALEHGTKYTLTVQVLVTDNFLGEFDMGGGEGPKNYHGGAVMYSFNLDNDPDLDITWEEGMAGIPPKPDGKWKSRHDTAFTTHLKGELHHPDQPNVLAETGLILPDDYFANDNFNRFGGAKNPPGGDPGETDWEEVVEGDFIWNSGQTQLVLTPSAWDSTLVYTLEGDPPQQPPAGGILGDETLLVPEPSTWALLAMGLVGLLIWRRRR